jgi:hypothetical protein
MCLSRFVITRSFHAWHTGDRDYPERRVSISPGPKDLFTEEMEGSSAYVKFLKNGLWYETARDDFECATLRELVASQSGR